VETLKYTIISSQQPNTQALIFLLER